MIMCVGGKRRKVTGRRVSKNGEKNTSGEQIITSSRLISGGGGTTRWTGEKKERLPRTLQGSLGIFQKGRRNEDLHVVK